MKYCFATLFLIYAVSAAPTNENENVQAAQFGMGYNPYMSHHSFYPMRQGPMGMYNNPMDMGIDSQDSFGPLNPDKYLNMKDEDFPLDYSLPCSNSCGCRQACMIVWWQPCTCRCPPPCGCVGCSWGCCKDRCCEDTTTVPTTTTVVETTTEIVTPGPDPPNGDDKCNGGSCCNSCSCMPCMMPIFWMCPPPCGGGCCGGNGGGSSCCNGSNNSCCNSGGGSNCCNSRNRSCCGK